MVVMAMALLATLAPRAWADSVIADAPASGKLIAPPMVVPPTTSMMPAPAYQRVRLPECPAVLRCRFSPAAYAQTDPHDPTQYGSYDLADRPGDGLAIQYIVVHDTEVSYAATLALFGDPTHRVSANYVIRSSDGQVTQMVDDQDVAWHAGNWYVNAHAIGIELEGFLVNGYTWYTNKEYQSLASLIRYLAHRYGIPVDRAHIIGHDQVPGPAAQYQAGMHFDPGPYFDWDRLMVTVRGGSSPRANDRDGFLSSPEKMTAVTIAPNFALNRPVLTNCMHPGSCATLPPEPASFVYLHTAARAAAPLVSDRLLRGTSLEPTGVGSTQVGDWGDKAVSGESFATAGQRGEWTGIWYGGQRAWFLNARGENSEQISATLVTPRAGVASIPVYGRAYPSSVSNDQLGYTIAAGQSYVANDLVDADFYTAQQFNAPLTYSVVTGAPEFYGIWFNHRLAYVRAGDVDVLHVR